MKVPMLLLSNEVTLGSIMKERGGYQLTKAQVRRAFFGDALTVTAVCKQCANSHTSTFEVRRSKTQVLIGCIRFRDADVKAVREWCGVNKVS